MDRDVQKAAGSSSKIDQLSSEAEEEFWRIAGNADGAGVALHQVGFNAKHLGELESAGLISRYTLEGEAFVQVVGVTMERERVWPVPQPKERVAPKDGRRAGAAAAPAIAKHSKPPAAPLRATVVRATLPQPNGNGTNGVVTSEHRQAARDAFDRWSSVSRGYGLAIETNEHTHVHNLLDAVAQDPPIIRAGEQIGRHLLVPQVVDSIRKDGKTEFKAVKYACAVVKSRLEEWSRKGVPGSGAQAGDEHDDVPEGPRSYNI